MEKFNILVAGIVSVALVLMPGKQKEGVKQTQEIIEVGEGLNPDTIKKLKRENLKDIEELVHQKEKVKIVEVKTKVEIPKSYETIYLKTKEGTWELTVPRDKGTKGFIIEIDSTYCK